MKKVSVQFSERELELISDAELIKTKVAISRKVKSILHNTQLKLQKHILTSKYDLPEEVLKISSKISVGENYQQLPYQMLDFPRLFGKKHTFAYRTMFWWGNFFSYTLHLGGKFLHPDLTERLIANKALSKNNIFFCVNNSPWHYHFDPDNYMLLNKTSSKIIGDQIAKHHFIKISAKTNLQHWYEVPENAILFLKSFLELTGW